MSRTDPPRIAVLGAGPIGLEAALYAATLGLPVTVYERGRVGEYVRRWGHVRLFTPFGMNCTPLGRAALLAESPKRARPGDSALLTGTEHADAYLDPLAALPALAGKIRAQTEVLSVGRRGFLKEEGVGEPRRGQQPFRLLLRDAKKVERVEEADVVLDCTGTYGQPRHLGDGGIPAVGELAARPHIAWGLDDVLGTRKGHYADRTTLVVGAGHSAGTTICLLASLTEKHPSTWVIWLARGTGSQPLRRQMNDPLRERDQLSARANWLATRGEGHVEFHPGAIVESVEGAGADSGFLVTARTGGKARTWEADRVVANVGYGPDTSLYRELQVHECYASLGPMALAAALSKHAGADCLAVPAQGAATLRNPEPGFFVLGIKSYGRSPNFLLRTGFEQVRAAFTLITGKADLDLYGKRG
jgi:thioredoxin reductase